MNDARPVTRPRLDTLDLVRGLAMVLMALDHVRDYVSPLPDGQTPEAAPELGLAWFLTRWVTHFCAPTFVFLAGASAWMYGSRSRTRAEVSRFLLTRGLWLMALEVFVITPAWLFLPPLSPWTIFQVIFAIGAGMVALAGLVWLPRGAIAAVALVTLATHNLLDGGGLDAWIAGLPPNDFPPGAIAYAFLRGGVTFFLAGNQLLLVVYALVPWTAVMLAGYAFGPVLGRLSNPPPDAPAADRAAARTCVRLGWALIGAFLVLRVTGVYGDPRPFAAVPGDPTQALIAVLNTTKYPPSLQYLLMTLGPALVLLGWLASRPALPRGTRWLVTFGRVPLFYYVLHIPLANAIGAIWFQWSMGLDRWTGAILTPIPGDGYAPRLWLTWLVWVALVAALYPLCRWYAGFRRHARGWWWSYL